MAWKTGVKLCFMSDKINPKIFKAYDIRGIYPTELNDDAAYLIGRAFARRAKAAEIIVGSDARLSGPALKKELLRGITDEGVTVLDIGLVPIDAVYAAVGKFGYPAGMMITASHNPKEYNGFKMVLSDMRWIRGEELAQDVASLADSPAVTKGVVRRVDLMPQYIQHVLAVADLAKIKPFKVVVDAGNGLAGKIMPLLAQHLPIQIIPLNFELDGNFPAHPSNPLLPESQAAAKEAIAKNQANFGVIFDGDTDRLIFLDEQGNFIAPDLVLLILAREFLNREPGKGIVYNVICSKAVPETVSQWGGKPLRSQVGYVNISRVMREQDGIMGGELSSHYSFRDNAFADSGFIAFLILLQLLSQDGRPLSQIAGELKKYFKSEEINLEVSDRQAVIAKIKEKYSAGQQDELDGLTVEYADWWFNARPSNTEPLLRLTIEANTAGLLAQKQKELLAFIKEAG